MSEEEKKKLKLILKKFKKNKLATKQLFNNEKKILLNSINQSNFNFLINENDNNKKKINMRKSLSFILCSSMINKFKTIY